MPILLEMIYADQYGNIQEKTGPRELYIPEANSPQDISANMLFDALENELEKYEPFDSSPIVIRWRVITSTVQ